MTDLAKWLQELALDTKRCDTADVYNVCKAAEELERLFTENRVLAESLLEAMEWNWLDEDWNEAMFDTFKAYADKALASISGNQK